MSDFNNSPMLYVNTNIIRLRTISETLTSSCKMKIISAKVLKKLGRAFTFGSSDAPAKKGRSLLVRCSFCHCQLMFWRDSLFTELTHKPRGKSNMTSSTDTANSSLNEYETCVFTNSSFTNL